MELEESTYLISGSATKPQLSRQYGTGTKTKEHYLSKGVLETNTLFLYFIALRSL